MTLLFAYLAGLLTLINPCVLPVLPIVLATAVQADRRGPIALAAGMSLSFVVFGMVVAVFGRSIGLTQETLSQIGAVIMVAFGVILVTPVVGHRFEAAMAGISGRADQAMATTAHGGVGAQFIGGALLGVVWSPCIGPTLGAAISLASQGQSLLWVFLIMLAFALGVATLIIGIGIGGQQVLRRRAQALRGLAARSRMILGVVFILVGLMILLRIHHAIDLWAIQNLPYWFQDLSIRY